MPHTASRSTTSIVGLAGVSKKNTLVFGRIASWNCCGSRASTIVVSMPNLGSSVSVSQRHEPKAARPADEMVALLELAEQGRGHRRHAGRHRAARLGAFEQGDALLEHLHRRVLQARIGHARPARPRSAPRHRPRNHRRSPR
jgi:hypothetical protein